MCDRPICCWGGRLSTVDRNCWVLRPPKMRIPRDCSRSTSKHPQPQHLCLQPRGEKCPFWPSPPKCSHWWHSRWLTPDERPSPCKNLQRPTSSLRRCSRSSRWSHSSPILLHRLTRTCPRCNQSLNFKSYWFLQPIGLFIGCFDRMIIEDTVSNNFNRFLPFAKVGARTKNRKSLLWNMTDCYPGSHYQLHSIELGINFCQLLQSSNKGIFF